jgi:hypothetical protein
MTVVQNGSNFVTQNTPFYCKRIKQIWESSWLSEGNVKVQNLINPLFEENLFPRLREITDMPDASTEEMFRVVDYLYWAK